jgi:hypothetical protein
VIDPALADQLVAPTEVNCCVCPRTTLAETGEIVAPATSVTVAAATPPGPAAMTVTVADDGMVEGAV